MHKVAPMVQSKINISILRIAKAIAGTLKHNNIQKVGLLGTKYAMAQYFSKDRLMEKGLDVVIT